MWTAREKPFTNRIGWVFEHLLTFLACNYPSNSQIFIHVKIGFSVDSEIGQIPQHCENPSKCAAKRKSWLTLAASMFLYLRPKYHENNSSSRENTSNFKNFQIMLNFTCKHFGLQNLIKLWFLCPDRWMGTTFTMGRRVASSLLQHPLQHTGTLLEGLTKLPVFLALVSDWSSRR